MNRKHLETADEIEENASLSHNAVKRTMGSSGQTCLSFNQSFAAVAVYWLIMSVIVAHHIYRSESNNTKLTEENLQLKTLMQNNQTDTTLTPESQNLKKKIQELETERNKLTEQINDVKTERNELNVSRAQWSIDAYCRIDEGRQCKACMKGWLLSQSSCFAFNEVYPPDRKSWEEARENCRGKSSDLAVVVKEAQKSFIRNWGDSGFWIGLRAEGGKWKWLDGSDLTETSWMTQQPADGHCVISVPYDRWKSVNCGEKHQWICQMKALSV